MKLAELLAKPSKIKESATAGATSAGNIASVANPNIARSKNTKDVSIFGGPAFKR
jgi:hypothetical protein